MRIGIRWAVALVAVVQATGVQAQDEIWTGEQIRAAWSGKKIFSRSPTAGLVEVRFNADGTAHVSAGGGSDSGTWRVTDKGYCLKWKQMRAGEERCFGVVKRGDKVLTLGPDGAVTSEVIRVID
jgi:uncharacterized membrane protein